MPAFDENTIDFDIDIDADTDAEPNFRSWAILDLPGGRNMLTGPWEIGEERCGWRGVSLYRARHLESGREYLLEDLALAAAAKDRIAREIAVGLENSLEAGAAIEHPALLKPIGLTRHGDRYFLVRPDEARLWDGWETVPRPADPDELGRWLLTMAEIVGRYHEAGLSTRGLAQVDLVTSADGLMVLDPIAQAYLAAYRDKETWRRFEHAPEVIRGASWGPAADLFAMGVEVYQLATGRGLFTGEGPELIHDVLRAAVLDPRFHNDAIGPGLAAAVLSILDRDPGRRPKANELAATLASLEKDGKLAATDADRAEFARRGQRLAELGARRERVRRFLRKNQTLLRIGLGVAAVVAIFFLLRGGPPAPVITASTTPAQVVEAHYRAIAALDHQTLEETLARNVGRDRLNMVLHLHVLHRARIAQEMLPFDTPGPLQVRDLAITESARTPPTYRARFLLVMERGAGEDRTLQIQECEDLLTLEKIKDRRVGEKWVIAELEQRILDERIVPAPSAPRTGEPGTEEPGGSPPEQGDE